LSLYRSIHSCRQKRREFKHNVQINKRIWNYVVNCWNTQKKL
jgi:hypothetical protein